MQICMYMCTYVNIEKGQQTAIYANVNACKNKKEGMATCDSRKSLWVHVCMHVIDVEKE
jgi:hypothetical protein